HTILNRRTDDTILVVTRSAHQIIIGGSHAPTDEYPIANSHIPGQPCMVLHFHLIADQGGVIDCHVSSDDTARTHFTLFSNLRAVADQGMRAYLDVVIDHGIRADHASVSHVDPGLKAHWAGHRPNSAGGLTEIRRWKDLHVVSDSDAVPDYYERVY